MPKRCDIGGRKECQKLNQTDRFTKLRPDMFSDYVENWLWGATRISTSLSRNKSNICLLKKDQHDFKTKMHNISSAVSQGALIRLIKASECITDAGLWSWELEIPGSTWITFKSLNYQALLELHESWHCTSITWELALPGITSSTWDSALLESWHCNCY